MKKAAEIVVLSLSLVFLFVLIALKLMASASVAYDKSERVSIQGEFPLVAILMAALIVSVLFAITKLCKNAKALYLVFCGITLLAGILYIWGVGGQLREDPLHVYETALQLSNKDFQAFEPGGYIFHKAHQLGLVTYERLLGLITFDVRLIFLLNLLFVNGINYLTYRLADLCFGQKERVNVLTVCLSYLFLPQFFFVVFAYGLVPGFFFLLLGIYLVQKYFKNGGALCAVLSIVSVTVAAGFKSNYLIGGIVVALLALLHAMKQKQGRMLFVALTALALPVCTLKALPLVYQLETGLPAVEGEPMITYVAMGVNPMNDGAGPGWYDGSNYNWYKNAGYDHTKTVERAEECLRNCMTVYKNEPVKTLKFFGRKTISQWCEPMFQSVWSGPLEAMGQQADSPILRPLFRGEGPEPYLREWMNGMLLLLYVGAFAFLIICRSGEHGMEYAFLFFIGGFLFHLVWEAKSQYIYPYVFILIPSVASTLDFMYHEIPKKPRKTKVKS